MEYTFEDMKHLLNAYYGYSTKDMQTVDVVKAMLEQEDFDVKIEPSTGYTVENVKFQIEEKYAIKNFNRRVTVQSIDKSANEKEQYYIVGNIHLKKLIDNYNAYPVDLQVLGYLANLGSSFFNFDTAKAALNFSHKEDVVFAQTLDQLKLLGYLKEPDTQFGNFLLYFDPSSNPTKYKHKKLKKHKRYAPITKQ